MSETEKLKDLQACDLAVFQARKRLGDIPAEKEAVRAGYAREKQKLAELDKRVKAREVTQKETELEVASREAEIKKKQARLMEVKTNRDYAALNTEIGNLKKEIADLEEQVLVLMEEVAAEKAARDMETRRIAEREDPVEQECRRLEEEERTLREQCAREEKRRPVLAGALSPETLSAYERLLTGCKNGLALVAVVKGNCLGCRMRVSTSTLDSLHRGTALVTCEHCGRLLFIER